MLKSIRSLYHVPLQPDSEVSSVVYELEGYLFQELIGVYARESADLSFTLFMNYIANSANDFPDEIKGELRELTDQKSIPKDVASIARFGQINQALVKCDAFLKEFKLENSQIRINSYLLERIKSEIFSLVRNGSESVNVTLTVFTET